jgi:hypothetical protein
LESAVGLRTEERSLWKRYIGRRDYRKSQKTVKKKGGTKHIMRQL